MAIDHTANFLPDSKTRKVEFPFQLENGSFGLIAVFEKGVLANHEVRVTKEVMTEALKNCKNQGLENSNFAKAYREALPFMDPPKV